VVLVRYAYAGHCVCFRVIVWRVVVYGVSSRIESASPLIICICWDRILLVRVWLCEDLYL